MKFLVIEKDELVIEDITFCLKVRYPDAAVIPVASGHQGIKLAEDESPDMVIVDSSLTDMATLDLVSEIRKFSDVGLIVVTEEQNAFERAKELEAGADDYIIKPFNPIEFLARVKALLRRTEVHGFDPQRLITIGNEIAINFTTREVIVSGKQRNLTPTEFELLSELVKNEGKVLTHSSLLEKIWGSEYLDEPSFVKKYVHRLRSKIEPDTNNPKMIITERGIGYKFVKYA